MSAPPIAWSDVIACAPELAPKVSVDAQDGILAFVNEAFADATLFGVAQLRLARINLAAHIATLMLRKQIAGPVTGETAGQVSRQYATLFTGKIFDGTSYGAIVTMLIQTSLARFPLVF